MAELVQEVSKVSARLGDVTAPCCGAGIPGTPGEAAVMVVSHTGRDRSACRTPLHGWLWSPCESEAGGLIAAQALL